MMIKADSFIVLRKSKPVFRISPMEDDASLWESVIDFTKVKKGGVSIRDLLSHLNKRQAQRENL
jgi:hypothetical protein